MLDWIGTYVHKKMGFDILPTIFNEFFYVFAEDD